MHKKDLRHKQYLKDQKRLDEIRVIIKQLPLIEIKEPYQYGWTLTLRLRADIERSDEAVALYEAMKYGFYSFETHTKDVRAVKIARKGLIGYMTVRNKSRDWACLLPSKQYYTPKKYKEIVPEKLNKYFTEKLHFGKEYFIINLPSYYYILKAKPFYITHERQLGGELVKEEAYLKNKISEYWRTAKGGNSHKWRKYGNEEGSRKTFERKEIRKFIKGETEDIFFNFREKKD